LSSFGAFILLSIDFVKIQKPLSLAKRLLL
jgi:hypothetical protein